MTEQEEKIWKENFIREGNRLIAEFMGYTYYHKGIYDEWTEYGGNEYKEIFSKVPIEVEGDEGDCFKQIPNPDYGKDLSESPRWSPSYEKLSWYTLNSSSFIYDLKYHEDWNWMMEVINRIHDLEWDDPNPEVQNNFHIMILKRHVRFIYDYDNWCIRPEDIVKDTTGEKFKKFEDSSKDYRYVIFDNSPLYATYCGVVDFIKWYNEKGKVK